MVALSATKSGVDPSEPLCRVTFREPGAGVRGDARSEDRVIRSAICEDRKLHLMAELARRLQASDLAP